MIREVYVFSWDWDEEAHPEMKLVLKDASLNGLKEKVQKLNDILDVDIFTHEGSSCALWKESIRHLSIDLVR